MKKWEVIKYKNCPAELIESQGKKLLIVDEEVSDFEVINTFKNFKFYKYLNKTIVESDLEALEGIAISINKLDLDLSSALVKLNEDFFRAGLDYKKFRGDLAELIFINLIKGKKINNNLSGDVEKNNKIYEVKSFSPQKKEIKISSIQLNEFTEKIAIPIKLDQNGKSMKELINEMEGNNEFSIYLKNQYSKYNIFKIKHTIEEYYLITQQIPKIKFPNNVIKAKLTILLKL